MPIPPPFRLPGSARALAAAALLLLVLLPGCLAAPIDRADSALERRVDQIGAEATRLGERLDAKVTAQREAAREDVVSVLAPVLAESAALRDESAAWRREAEKRADAALAESAAWRADAAAARDAALEESRAWREQFAAFNVTAAKATEESAAWRRDVAPVLAAFSGRPAATAAPAPAAPATGPAPSEPLGPLEELPWGEIAGAGAAVFLAARAYLNRGKARLPLEAVRWVEEKCRHERYGSSHRDAPPA